MPLVEITLLEGRSPEMRLELMRSVTAAVEQSLGAAPDAIRVILREVPAFHWATGGVPKGPTPDA